MALAVALGCGGDEAVSVTGTVKKADGSNLQFENGLVVFQPIGEGKSASGALEEDGSFTMMTEKPGDGVTPGSYKVLLKIWKNYREQTSAVPERYADPATTPLEATVDSDNTHFDFVVEP
jgi:hypothetical protein